MDPYGSQQVFEERRRLEALIALRDRYATEPIEVAVPLNGRPLDVVATFVSAAWQLDNPKEEKSQ